MGAKQTGFLVLVLECWAYRTRQKHGMCRIVATTTCLSETIRDTIITDSIIGGRLAGT